MKTFLHLLIKGLVQEKFIHMETWPPTILSECRAMLPSIFLCVVIHHSCFFMQSGFLLRVGVLKAYGHVPVLLSIPNLKSAIGISCTYKLPTCASRGSSTISCGRQTMTTLYIIYVQDFTGSRIIATMGKSALTHCSCISRLKIWKRSCFLKFHWAWLTAQFCRLGRFSIIIFL